MENLPAVVASGLRLTLRGWLLLFALAFLRLAAGVTGLLPWLLAFAAALRLVLGAPPDPATGLPDLSVALRAALGDPRVTAGLAGITAVALSFQFLLASLADAGLFGEIGAAAREGRDPRVGGFLRSSLRFFGRAAAMKLLWLAVRLAVLAVLAGAGAAVWRVYGDALRAADFPSRTVLLLAGATLAAAFYAWASVTAGLLFAAAAAAATVEDLPLGAAFRRGALFLGRRIRTLLVLFAFFGAVWMLWTTLAVCGQLWGSELAAQAPGARWPVSAALAWNFTFAILGEVLALWAVAGTALLYVRAMTPPDAAPGGKTARP